MARNESLPSLKSNLAKICRALSQMNHRLIVRTENRDARFQFRHHHELVPCVEVTGIIQSSGKSQVLALQREILQAIIAAIGDGKDGHRAAPVHPDTVRLIQFPRIGAQAAERLDVFSLAVILQNKTRAIAVGDVEIAIRRDGEIGRAPRNFFSPHTLPNDPDTLSGKPPRRRAWP